MFNRRLLKKHRPKRKRYNAVDQKHCITQFDIFIKEESLQKMIHKFKIESEYTPPEFKSEGRKYAFDRAIPELRLLFDIQGGTTGARSAKNKLGKSGHTTLFGYAKDREKHNLAQIHNYFTMEVEFVMLQSGLFINLCTRAILTQKVKLGFIA